MGRLSSIVSPAFHPRRSAAYPRETEGDAGEPFTRIDGFEAHPGSRTCTVNSAGDSGCTAIFTAPSHGKFVVCCRLTRLEPTCAVALLAMNRFTQRPSLDLL